MLNFLRRKKLSQKPVDEINKGDIVTVYDGEDVYKGIVVNASPKLVEICSTTRTVLSVPRGTVQKDALATKHRADVNQFRQVA